MNLWNQLYARLMNEAEGGEGNNGAGGNPLGNIGESDYLNEPDNGGDNDKTTDTGAPSDDGLLDNSNTGNDDSDRGKPADDNDSNPNLIKDGLLDDTKEPDKDGEGKEPDKESDKEPDGEEVEYKFELPEGFTLPDAVKDDITAMAKEHKLPADVVQKFVTKHAEIKQQELEVARQTIQSWKAETVADPVLGGDNLPGTLKNVNNALSIDGGAEVKEILQQTGLQNHPAFIKFLNAYGKMIRTDSNRSGKIGAAETTDQDAINSFY